MSNEEFVPDTDTGLPERLNFYLNIRMFRERRKHKKNNNKSKYVLLS